MGQPYRKPEDEEDEGDRADRKEGVVSS